jgi:hypothetical protein
VQIEAREVRVPRSGRQHPRRVGIGPNTPHTRPRAGTVPRRPPAPRIARSVATA